WVMYSALLAGRRSDITTLPIRAPISRELVLRRQLGDDGDLIVVGNIVYFCALCQYQHQSADAWQRIASLAMLVTCSPWATRPMILAPSRLMGAPSAPHSGLAV